MRAADQTQRLHHLRRSGSEKTDSRRDNQIHRKYIQFKTWILFNDIIRLTIYMLNKVDIVMDRSNVGKNYGIILLVCNYYLFSLILLSKLLLSFVLSSLKV